MADSDDGTNNAFLVHDYASGNTLELTNAQEVCIGCAVCGHKTGKRGRYRVSEKPPAAPAISTKPNGTELRDALVCQDECARHWQMSLARPAQYASKVGVDVTRVLTAAHPSGSPGWCVTCGVLPAQLKVKCPQLQQKKVGVCSHQCGDAVLHDVQCTLLGDQLPSLDAYLHRPVNIASVLGSFRKGYDTKVIADHLYALREAASQDNATVTEMMRDQVRPELVYWLHHSRPTLTAEGIHASLDRFYVAVSERISVLDQGAGWRTTFGNTGGLFVGEVDSVGFDARLLAMHMAQWVLDYIDDPMVRGAVLVREAVGRIYRMLWGVIRGSVGNFMRAAFSALSAGVVTTQVDADSLTAPALIGGPLDYLKGKTKGALAKAASAITPKPYSVDALGAELIKQARVVACFREQELKLGDKALFQQMDAAIASGAAYEAFMEGLLASGINPTGAPLDDNKRLQLVAVRAMFGDFQRRLDANTTLATAGKFNPQRDCKPGSLTSNPQLAGRQWYAMYTRYVSIDGMTKQADKDKATTTLLADFDKLVALLIKDMGDKTAVSFLATYLSTMGVLVDKMVPPPTSQ